MILIFINCDRDIHNMGFGKVAAIISGILSLIAIFLLSWVDPAGSSYVSGIGGAMNIPDLFGALGDNIAASIGMGGWIVYIILLVEILVLISFIFMFIGTKVRFLAFLGGFFPFLLGVFLILGGLLDVGFINNFVDVVSATAGQSDELVSGILPFTLVFADITLGSVLMTLSGLLGMISGFMKRDDLF